MSSMAVIIGMVRKEFHQIRQDRRMLVISILAPVLQVLLLGYAATTDIRNSALVLCDMDNTADSRAFVREFTSSGYFVLTRSITRSADVDLSLDDGTAAIALLIPRGFGGDLLARRPAQIQVILDGADANTASVLMGYVSQIVASTTAKVVARTAFAGSRGRVPRIVPEPRVWFNADLRSSYFMVPGVVALVLMIITMTLTALGIVKEKEIGTLEQLMVTPIRSYELIIGKLIPFVLIGFLDVAIVLALARYWFEVPLVGSLPLLLGLSGLFILTTLGLGLFVSTIARTQQQAMLIAQFFFFMPFMFLSGFAFPISNMPAAVQAVTYLIPLRYFLEIVRGVFLKGSNLLQLWPQTLALLGFGVTILTLSVLRFRKTLE